MTSETLIHFESDGFKTRFPKKIRDQNRSVPLSINNASSNKNKIEFPEEPIVISPKKVELPSQTDIEDGFISDLLIATLRSMDKSISTFIDRFKKDNFNFLLLGLLFFQLLVFFIFHILDKSYQTWDSAGHIGMAYNIAEQLRRLMGGTISVADFIKTSDYYPPFVQTIAGVLALFLGYNTMLILCVTLVFFLLAIIFLYVDVKKLTGNSSIAFKTAFVFSFFPQVFEQSRVFHLDMPLIALLLIAIYFLLKSNGFTRKTYAVLFGITFAFIQLTKWYGFIYLTVPFIYYMYIYLDFVKRRYLDVSINVALNLFVVALIALPWYLFNYSKLIEYTAIFSQAELDDPIGFFNLNNLLYYPMVILSHQIFLVPFILLVLAVARTAYRCKSKPENAFFLLTLFFPIIVFTAIGNKNLRYVMPLTPLFAYMIVDFAGTVFAGIKRQILLYSLAVYMLFAFFFCSFNQVPAGTSWLKPVGIAFSANYYGTWMYEPQLYGYSSQHWPLDEIWDFIKDDSTTIKGAFGVTPLFDKKTLSLATFELIRREKHFDNVFVPVPYFQFEPFRTNAEMQKYLTDNAVEYVLVTNDPGPQGLRNYAVLTQMTSYFLSNRNNNYELVKTFELPDASTLRIFKKLPEGVKPRANLNTKMICKNDAGKNTGIEQIKLEQNHSYIFYTGNFQVDKINGEYAKDNLFILQIENIPHQSRLDVFGLPHVGTSMCTFDNLDIDVSESIKKPLTEAGHCGEDCQTVTHIKWRVGHEKFEQKVYTRQDFGESSSQGIVDTPKPTVTAKAKPLPSDNSTGITN